MDLLIIINCGCRGRHVISSLVYSLKPECNNRPTFDSFDVDANGPGLGLHLEGDIALVGEERS